MKGAVISMKAKQYKPRRYRTTLLPAYVLFIKGKLDSKKGASAIEAYVNKLVHKARTHEVLSEVRSLKLKTKMKP